MSNYKLTVPPTRLRAARTMTAAELKTITEKELLEYTSFWETDMIADMDRDNGLASEKFDQAMNVMTDLFGDESKQVKYLLRNYNKGDNLTNRFYKQFVPPSTIARWMNCVEQVAPEFVFGEKY
jgi:hypothetical protein